MRPKLPEAKTKSQNTSKEERVIGKKYNNYRSLIVAVNKKKSKGPFRAGKKWTRSYKTSQCFIKKNNGTSVALSAVQTQTKLFCVEKMFFTVCKNKKIKPSTEKDAANSSCPHPITASIGNLASDGGSGMRLCAPTESLLNHLLREEGSISWGCGKRRRRRPHVRHRLGSRRLVPADEDRGYSVERRRVRCREVIGGQGTVELHLNGVKAVVSRRTGVVKRVSHRRH